MEKGGAVGSGTALAGHTPRAGALVALLLFALVTAACSDGEGTAEDAPTSTTTVGVNEPTPPVDPGASQGEVVADPVDLSQDATFGNGVVARIDAIEAVQVEGSGPREISGPGVALTVEVRNGSDQSIDLDQVLVDLMDAELASASPIVPPEPEGLSGPLAPGESASGRYQFTLPVADRADVTVRISYTVDAPTVLLTGDLPDA